jgi:hypothetical protein
MSKQPENEALTPQLLRQALLSELEASQQTLVELSDEQLEAVAGAGIGSFFKHVGQGFKDFGSGFGQAFKSDYGI